jgi:hypothetical protein
MPDFPIDPELRIRAGLPVVLRRTTEAVDFIRKVTLSSPDRAWQDVLQSFEAARDEWSARFSFWARSVSRCLDRGSREVMSSPDLRGK